MGNIFQNGWNYLSNTVDHAGQVVGEFGQHVIDVANNIVEKIIPSEFRTVVATTVSRVIEDALIPSATERGITKAIFQDGDVVSSVSEEMVTSLAVRAERMYVYGGAHYTYGLPTGELFVPKQEDTVLTQVLTGVEGAPVTLSYYTYGNINLQHVVWDVLVDTHGYSPISNQFAGLTITKATAVYLDSINLVLPDDAAVTDNILKLYGPTDRAGYCPTRQHLSEDTRALLLRSPILQVPAPSPIHAIVTYAWADLDFPGGYQTAAFNVDLSGFDIKATYYQAQYLVGGAVKFFTYVEGTGTYPLLDNFYNASATAIGEFFPLLHFRQNAATLSGDINSQGYKTSVKLAKYIGVDYQSMATAIDNNPDIAMVEQAFMMMAVPANTTNPLEQEYLYKFFDRQRSVAGNLAPVVTTTTASALLNYFGNPLYKSRGASAITIRDALFTMSLGNEGIFKRRVVGSIGAIGTYSSGRGGAPNSDTLLSPGTLILSHIYRKQITANLYDEITVMRLSMTYHIWGAHNTVADDVANSLMVPLDITITRDFSILDRETLYARSLHYVFNSRNTTEVKWYQQPAFHILLTIAAVAITIVNPPAGGWTFAAIATSVAAAIAVQVVFKVVVRLIGPQAAFIFAIVAIAWGAYEALGGGVAGAPTAQMLLSISTGLTGGISSYMKDAFEAIQRDTEEFSTTSKEETAALKAAQALLNDGRRMTPLFIAGETPTEYFQRTVHSGNIGTHVLDATSEFVENALALPRLNATIGDYEYA